ncbi:CYFIP-related Rac1 interactor A isoform X2 [Balearica regulorum gibbericeps]|uniref:CYFIP-related Rac1 interactor A isoform X2 n=1 Tax=Balearica regulorum gibbericeps TaxID=100784 RepID=UPI003F621183
MAAAPPSPRRREAGLREPRPPARPGRPPAGAARSHRGAGLRASRWAGPGWAAPRSAAQHRRLSLRRGGWTRVPVAASGDGRLRNQMGNLLKVLTCTELDQGPNFFLDFENAQPTDGEREVWNQISAVLQDSESMLADLQAYKGAGQEIRDAIQNPNDIQLQEKAWNSVCPLVVRLKRFYEFSLRLEKALQSLLESLTCPPYTPTQHLEREQALAKEFAEILHFTLRFDELKMRNPAIQNDFSYYRRTISRNRINNMHLDIENEVNNEMANRMSLFYAEATPMLKTLSNATTHFVSENKTLPIENTTDCLSTMASVCKVMLETPEYRSRFTSEETLMFCMRVMVGVIILYDHVHPVGAFSKTSKIDMKGCIKVLKEQPPDTVEGLLNALRFTTKHLNDESTSKQIRAMLQ